MAKTYPMWYTAFYVWLLPEKEAKNIDTLIAEGALPELATLAPALQVAIALTVLRAVLDRFVFTPAAVFFIGLHVVKEPPRIASLSLPELEGKIPTKAAVKHAAAQSGYSTEYVREHLAARRRAGLARKRIQKYNEACWRLLLYVFAVALGFWSLREEPFFQDPYGECWKEWPRQVVPPAVAFYYAFELGLYAHLAVRMCIEVRRRDFWEMAAHHAMTLGLILFSWLCSMSRVGALTMLLHDLSDVPLELAKLFNYAKANKRFPHARHAADGVFFLFAATFVMTRLYLYPKYIIYTTSVLLLRHIGWCNTIYFYNALLGGLQLLHIFWAGLIFRMVYLFLVKGVEKDVRSDTDDDDEDFGVGGNNGGAAGAAAAAGGSGVGAASTGGTNHGDKARPIAHRKGR